MIICLWENGGLRSVKDREKFVKIFFPDIKVYVIKRDLHYLAKNGIIDKKLNTLIEWTKEEEETIKKNYKLGTESLLKLLPNRSNPRIQWKANKLGLKIPKKGSWSKDEEIILRDNYKKGMDVLISLFLNRSKFAIREKAIRLNIKIPNYYVAGHQWTDEEIQICKKYFPILGRSKPRYHKSLRDFLPHLTEGQIQIYCRNKLNIKVDSQKDVPINFRRCRDCLKIKSFSDFVTLPPSKKITSKNKGYYFQCRECSIKSREEHYLKTQSFISTSGKEFIADNKLLLTLSRNLKREKKHLPIPEREKLLANIIEEIGLPEGCFFESIFCGNIDNHSSKIHLGHKIPIVKGGTTLDPTNLFWICQRHNVIMGRRSFDDLYLIIKSMYKKL